MIRRLLAALIVLVGLAGVVVAALSTFAAVEDRTTTLHPGAVLGVDVDVEAGRVVVVAGDSAEVKVDRTRRFIRGAPMTSEALVDGVLRVEAKCRRFIAVGCAVDYRIEVPRSVSVKVRTERGSVTVADTVGMVDVQTSAGGVHLARTRGPVQVRTSAGSVDGVDVVASFLDATTDAGRIRLSLAEPADRVGLRTDGGSIDLALPPVPGGYRVATDAGAGKVEVSVAQDPGAGPAITAKTGAGNIRIRPR